MQYRFVIFGLLIAGPLSPALAQSTSASQDNPPSRAADNSNIESLEVRASKSQDPSSITLVDNRLYTGFNQSIDRSTFEGRLVNFSEMLNRLPGIQVKQSGGFGSNSSVTLRGTGNKRVSLFLDGMPLSSSASGNAKLHYIPAVLIEKIDAYPYFTPVELGNANIGGALNFSSRNITQTEAGAQLSLARGSMSTEFEELSAWSSRDEYEAMVGYSAIRSQNDADVKLEAFLSEFDTRDGSKIVTRQNDAVDQTSLFFKGARQWDKLGVNVMLQHYDVEKEIPTPLNSVNDDAKLIEENFAIQALFDYNVGNWQFGHRPFYLKETIFLEDPNNKVGLNANLTRTQTDKIGLANHAKLAVGDHLFAINLELQQDDLAQRDLLNASLARNTERQSVITALSDNWQLTPNVKLAAVLRYYHVSDETKREIANAETQTDKNTETAWHTGISWEINERLKFNSNIGQSVRIPTLYEKFGSAGEYEGNDELKREKATLTFDLGFIYKADQIEASINGFYSELEDGIVITYDSRGVGKPSNIDKSISGGFAFNMAWQAFQWLELGSNATLLLSENKANIRSQDNKKLPGIYHNSVGAFINIYHHFGKWNLSYNRDGELYYLPENSLKADDKQLIDTSLTLYFDYVTLDISARNLLDKNYQDFNYRPTPGRTFLATLTINI